MLGLMCKIHRDLNNTFSSRYHVKGWHVMHKFVIHIGKYGKGCMLSI